MEKIPIRIASGTQEQALSDRSKTIIEATRKVQEEEGKFFEPLASRSYDSRIPKGLEGYWLLNEPRFMEIVRKKRLGAGPLFERQISQEFLRSRGIVRPLRQEIRKLEIELHHLVFDLYGLTPEEVRLVRETAPPRDPLTLAEQELALLEVP